VEWNGWNKKRIFIRLKTGDCYTGLVIAVDSDLDNSGFITIIDKYDDKIAIAISEISKIKEEGEKKW
jgi:hypothetical protein